MKLGAPVFGTDMFIIVISSGCIAPFISMKSALSDMSIATTAYFQFQFIWNNFFYHFTLSLFVFANEDVSGRQQRVRSCFFNPICLSMSFD
jgi:ABC-type uncharacterized transport system permease subunit